LGTKRKDDFQPYWQDEKDWLCIVEFLPTDNPEARLFGADTIGYPVGYANTRPLALLGYPDASAYELLFSFSSPGEKNKFLNLVRSNEDMGNDFIIEFTEFTPPTTEEIRNARPLATVLPLDALPHAMLIAVSRCVVRTARNRFRRFWKRVDSAERWSREGFRLAMQTKGSGRFAKRMLL
jgi:hypothetical protein